MKDLFLDGSLYVGVSTDENGRAIVCMRLIRKKDDEATVYLLTPLVAIVLKMLLATAIDASSLANEHDMTKGAVE